MRAASSHAVILALRRATAERHAAVERLVDIDTFVDAVRYVKVLTAFDAFLEAWEPRVQAALPKAWAEWFVTRSRRPFLKKDMAALGARPFTLSASLSSRLRLETATAAFGSMYVLEGAALGGLVIARRVAEALHITADNGGAFFAGWGDDTARRWREFRQVLESEIDWAPDSVQQACVAAVETFDVLHESFSRALHDDAARPLDNAA
jgi:heme oxygenase